MCVALYPVLCRRLEARQTSGGPLLAPVQTALAQAWNQRIKDKLGLENKMPIGMNLVVRTEFSGTGTAEESLDAVAALYNQNHSAQQLKVNHVSFADWGRSARETAALNRPNQCRFSDIMSLCPKQLREKLEERVVDKARLGVARVCKNSCLNS